MAAAFIEHRPKGTDPKAQTSHYVTVLAGGSEVGGAFKTQKAAHDKAFADGYRPVHVARVRHGYDHGHPDHFRVDLC